MPTSSSGRSSIQGLRRRLASITPTAPGATSALPPGDCSFWLRFLTLRLTVSARAAALLTVTRSGPYAAKSISPALKNTVAPGQAYRVPAVT